MIDRSKISARRAARILALQGLYAWEMTQNNLALIERDLLSGHYCELLDVEQTSLLETYPVSAQYLDRMYFRELLNQVPQHKVAIDKHLKAFMSRELKQVGPTEYAILRIAIYELLIHPEIPFKVVLNEAIELSKDYGCQDSYKFVNGVLEKVAFDIKKQAAYSA